MKQLWIRGLSGLALAFAAHAALATPVVITSTATSGPKILATSQATYTLSPFVVATLNAYKGNQALPSFTAEGGATASIGYGYNPITKLTKFNTLSFSTPVTSMTYESMDQAILGQALKGSLKIVVAPNSTGVFSRGGEIVIGDLKVDHSTKTVYANVSGTNGYGTRQNVPFWSYTESIGSLTFTGGNIGTTLKVLRFTNDGLNAWAQSLALTTDAINGLKKISADAAGLGNMTITVNTTPSEAPTCTAP